MKSNFQLRIYFLQYLINSGAILQVFVADTHEQGCTAATLPGVIGQHSNTGRDKMMKVAVVTNIIHRITEYSELQRTHKDLQVQL